MNKYLYNLIIAVLRQAARDYIVAIRKRNLHKINELEQFFLSDYGQAMSMNNGEKIILRCRKIARQKMRGERKYGVSNSNKRNP